MKTKTEEERNECFYRILAFEAIIDEVFIWYSKGSLIPKFRKDLRKIGYRITKDIDMQYYCQRHASETRKLVLEYYLKTKNLYDKHFFIMCLCNKENSDLFDFFISELKKYFPLKMEECYACDVISELLYITRDIKYKEEYLKYFNCIKRNHKKYWIGRNYTWVIKIMGEFQLEEAVKRLIEVAKTCYDWDYDTALEALKKYDNQKRFQKIYNSYQKWSRESIYRFYSKYLKEQDEKVKMGFYPNKSTIRKFELVLQEKFEIPSKISIQDYCQKNPKETKPIVLDFYKKSTLPSDQRFYLNCLKNAENKDLFPFLIKELKIHAKKTIPYNFGTSINSFFIHTRDKSLGEKYVKVLTTERFNLPLSGLFEAVSKLQIKSAEPFMLEILKNEDDPNKEDALDYFIRNKNIQNYENIFKKYLNSPYLCERKLANKGLEKIERKKEKELQKKKSITK